MQLQVGSVVRFFRVEYEIVDLGPICCREELRGAFKKQQQLLTRTGHSGELLHEERCHSLLCRLFGIGPENGNPRKRESVEAQFTGASDNLIQIGTQSG